MRQEKKIKWDEKNREGCCCCRRRFFRLTSRKVQQFKVISSFLNHQPPTDTNTVSLSTFLWRTFLVNINTPKYLDYLLSRQCFLWKRKKSFFCALLVWAFLPRANVWCPWQMWCDYQISNIYASPLFSLSLFCLWWNLGNEFRFNSQKFD